MRHKASKTAPVELVLGKLEDPTKTSDGWRARCPAHSGTSNDSLSVTSGDDGRALVFCHSGCDTETIVKAMGLSVTDLGGEKKKRVFPTVTGAIAAYEKRLGKHSSRWDYHNAKGEHIGSTVRWSKADGTKEIRPVSKLPDGWSLCGLPKPRPLYRLPELTNAQRVFVVEGEKAADAASSLGLVCTTSMNGSKAPGKTDWSPLAGREIVILPDNDDPGRKYASTVTRILTRLSPPASVRVITLPDLPSKGDVFDFIELRRGQGLSDEVIRSEIEGLCDAAACVTPPNDADELGSTDEDDGEEHKGPRKSAATKLLQLVDGIELFHTPGGHDANGYAMFQVRDHTETWPVRSRAFKMHLQWVYFEEYGCALNSEALGDAVNTLAAQALFRGKEAPVALRVAGHEGSIYYDLADSKWGCVKIDKSGWKVLDRSPVHFVRRRGMLPTPAPEVGGSVDDLRELINVTDEAFWALILAWLIAAVRPVGPYPVLNLDGEQGSGKTTAAKMLRALIDPNECPVRSEPREPRDLAIAASNALMVMFDNLSRIPTWFSDGLCRLATGGGFATRELYTDDDEKLFTTQRPALVNGIGNIIERPDLLDRALLINLPPIPEDKRRPEFVLWARFHAIRSRVLGALFDAVAVALRRHSSVNLSKLPRMADFAIWTTAAEPALGLPDGAILKAHTESRAESTNIAIESSLVGAAVQLFTESMPAWCGTMTELLTALNATGDETARKGREKNPQWPKTGRGLSGELKRIAPELRAIGINAVPPKTGDRRRIWFLTREPAGTTAQTAHNAEGPPADSADAGLARAVDQTQPPNRPVDRPSEIPSDGIKTADSGDSGDSGGQIPPSSEREEFDI